MIRDQSPPGPRSLRTKDPTFQKWTEQWTWGELNCSNDYQIRELLKYLEKVRSSNLSNQSSSVHFCQTRTLHSPIPFPFNKPFANIYIHKTSISVDQDTLWQMIKCSGKFSPNFSEYFRTLFPLSMFHSTIFHSFIKWNGNVMRWLQSKLCFHGTAKNISIFIQFFIVLLWY